MSKLATKYGFNTNIKTSEHHVFSFFELDEFYSDKIWTSTSKLNAICFALSSEETRRSNQTEINYMYRLDNLPQNRTRS